MKSIAAMLFGVAWCGVVPGVVPVASAATERPATITIAEQRERGDYVRLEHHAAAARVARRDLQAVELQVEATRSRWDDAVAHGRVNAAGYWAQQHGAALAAERAANGRWLDERAERELARADLRSDADQLRQLRVASLASR